MRPSAQGLDRDRSGSESVAGAGATGGGSGAGSGGGGGVGRAGEGGEQPSPHVIHAMIGFFRSIALGQNESVANVLQVG